MREIFVNCDQCGHANPMKGVDPDTLELFRANKDPVNCQKEKCRARLNCWNAYLGEDIGDGTIIRVGPK